MSNSNLVSYVKLSPCITTPRKHQISRITIHCFVGKCIVESMCGYFSNRNNNVSCNYVVDIYGEIGLVANEEARSWCSSNRDNDNRAVTIEVASEREPPYSITNRSLKSLISLCTDICERNGKKKLLWINDKERALSYVPENNEMLLTVHRWFAKKECPGEYIFNLLPAISREVTSSLSSETEVISSDMQWAIDNGLFGGYKNGLYGPKDPLTREQAATLFRRYTEKFIQK